MKQKIFIGADHRGFELKMHLIDWLEQSGRQVTDLGAYELDPIDDYADFAFAVGEAVVREAGLGVVICGSSIGVTIAANKVKGVRAASACDELAVAHGRERDGLNVLALAADEVELDKAKKMVWRFLTTRPINAPRFVRRVEKIKQYEKYSTLKIKEENDSLSGYFNRQS